MSDALVPAGPDDAYALELLRRQDALQAEARRVVAELDLVPLLSRAGRVEQVGSSVSGLMVWRDIDFTVLCRDLTTERAPQSRIELYGTRDRTP